MLDRMKRTTKRYVVAELPPYQSDPRVLESLLNDAAAHCYYCEWVIPVGGRSLRWAGVFTLKGTDMYEYRVVQFPPYASDIRLVESRLNELWSDGWELLDILVMGRRGAHVVGIFRRSKQDESQEEPQARSRGRARSA